MYYAFDVSNILVNVEVEADVEIELRLMLMLMSRRLMLDGVGLCNFCPREFQI